MVYRGHSISHFPAYRTSKINMEFDVWPFFVRDRAPNVRFMLIGGRVLTFITHGTPKGGAFPKTSSRVPTYQRKLGVLKGTTRKETKDTPRTEDTLRPSWAPLLTTSVRMASVGQEQSISDMKEDIEACAGVGQLAFCVLLLWTPSFKVGPCIFR